MPTAGGGDDFVWVGGPGEGPGLLVVVGDEAVDGGLEIDDALEDAALEATLGKDGEEALDGVEPAGRGGREVERPARMAAQPGNHLGVFVGGIVVENGVDDKLTVSDVMHPALTIDIHASLRAAADLMIQKHHHRLIVIDQDDPQAFPLGIISSYDIVAEMARPTSVWQMQQP